MTKEYEYYGTNSHYFLDNDQEDDVHPALTHQDVLEQVFSFLSSPTDLKNCRLVSQMWEEGATRVLGKRSVFPIQKLLPPPPPLPSPRQEDPQEHQSEDANIAEIAKNPVKILEIPKLIVHQPPHPHILRNILVIDPQPVCVPPRIPPLETLLPVLNPPLVSEFVFRGAIFFPGLSVFLENVRYPHLQKLSLLEPPHVDQDSIELPRYHADQVVDVDTDVDVAEGDKDHGLKPLKALQADVDPTSMFNLNLRTVTRLHFSVALHGLGYANSSNFATFQMLIQKCGNLQELKISGNYYPDLRSCGRLKRLIWEGPRTSFDEESDLIFETTDFSLTKLIKMLEGVADKLEKLVLGCSCTEQEARARYVRGIIDMEEEIQTVKNVSYELYPKMPKLAHFFISDINIFAPSPQSFTLKRLPALKSLTLRSTQKYEFAVCGNSWLENKNPVINPYLRKWRNMILAPESLAINQCPAGVSDIWSGISSIFPNLRKLSLGMTARDDPHRSARYDPEHEREASFMKCTLNIIAHLLPRLEDLRIHLKFGCTLEELMDTIWAKGFQGKGLKNLKIEAYLPSTDNNKFFGNSCDNFRAPFMLYKNLTLEGFEIEHATRQRMVNFIKKRKLNVNLFT